jgi:hypothetical protein
MNNDEEKKSGKFLGDNMNNPKEVAEGISTTEAEGIHKKGKEDSEDYDDIAVPMFGLNDNYIVK